MGKHIRSDFERYNLYLTTKYAHFSRNSAIVIRQFRKFVWGLVPVGRLHMSWRSATYAFTQHTPLFRCPGIHPFVSLPKFTAGRRPQGVHPVNSASNDDAHDVVEDAHDVVEEGAGAAASHSQLKNEQNLVRRAKSVEELMFLAKDNPDNVHILIAAAKRLSWDPRKADELYDMALEKACTDVDTAFVLVSWAAAWTKRRHFVKAEKLLRQAMATAPNVPSAFNAFGKLKERQNDHKAAEDYYRQALAIEPNHVPTLQALAMLSTLRKQHASAAKYFQRAVATAPHDPKIWTAWADSEWRQRGRYAQAKELFERGIEKCPAHAPLLIAYAKCEASRRARTKAKALLRQAITVDPCEPRAYLLLAQLEGRTGNAWAAIELCRQGLQRCPGNVHLLCTLGQVSAGAGDHAAASGAWQEALRKNPHCAVAAHELGLAKQKDGEFDQAEVLFRRGAEGKASKMDAKGSLRCAASLAELLAFRGDAHGARETMKAASQRCTPDGRFLRQWATLEKRLGDLSAASNLFRRAAKANPADERTWLQYGLLERRRGDIASAAACFRAGLKVSPLNPYLWQLYASALWEKGDIDEGRRVYAEALQRCPNNQPLLLEYGLKEARSDDDEAAIKIFRMAEGVMPLHAPLLAAWEQSALRLNRKEEADKVRRRLREALVQKQKR